MSRRVCCRSVHAIGLIKLIKLIEPIEMTFQRIDMGRPEPAKGDEPIIHLAQCLGL